MPKQGVSVGPVSSPSTGRRALLRSAFAFAAAIATMGHAPYGQWNVYRKRNLLILTSRSDAPSFAIGEQVASVLARHLPESRARVSRAPSIRRVASLISTRQMDVAVLSRDNAADLHAGRAAFAEFGPVILRTIVVLEDYLLICRDDFAPLHAYLLAETLMENSSELNVTVAAADAAKESGNLSVPIHPGAWDYFKGRLPPED